MKQEELVICWVSRGGVCGNKVMHAEDVAVAYVPCVAAEALRAEPMIRLVEMSLPLFQLPRGWDLL